MSGDSDNIFVCERCEKQFSLPPKILDKYPGWRPKLCLRCRDASRRGSSGRSGGRRAKARSGPSSSKELVLPVAEVLRRFSGGPRDGVFTDGACSGNPGPGGWGVVVVEADEIIAQRHGHDPATTNNRMELRALIEGYRLLSQDASTTIYSDSRLCVNTINDWAAAWKARGWRRKGGPVKNLELVKEAYDLALAHPGVALRWIKAHDGSRWNEYADALATAYLRDEL